MLSTFPGLSTFSQVGVPLDMKNYFEGSSVEEMLRNIFLIIHNLVCILQFTDCSDIDNSRKQISMFDSYLPICRIHDRL
jgi:hypothetical protein